MQRPQTVHSAEVADSVIVERIIIAFPSTKVRLPFITIVYAIVFVDIGFVVVGEKGSGKLFSVFGAAEASLLQLCGKRSVLVPPGGGISFSSNASHHPLSSSIYTPQTDRQTDRTFPPAPSSICSVATHHPPNQRGEWTRKFDCSSCRPSNNSNSRGVPPKVSRKLYIPSYYRRSTSNSRTPPPPSPLPQRRLLPGI